MKAGPALNTLIAEKVMGWRIVTGWWFNNQGEAVAPVEEWPSGAKPFAPSTDMFFAWQVVEKMRELEWMVTVMNWKRDGKLSYSAEFANGPFAPRHKEYSEDSPAHAICLAALKVLGVEITADNRQGPRPIEGAEDGGEEGNG